MRLNVPGHRCIDGSVEGDLPMQRIAELFGVNHFIVAQGIDKKTFTESQSICYSIHEK